MIKIKMKNEFEKIFILEHVFLFFVFVMRVHVVYVEYTPDFEY
jgi:hypothetical protein